MYQILARKYRPQNLHELIGQEVLARTISNAVKYQHIPQAILLSGSYGIGKTTTARVIAKILNCTNLDTDHEYIIACNKCQQCQEINKGIHPDVLEIDAASNTGVDHVRSLIENSQYAPIQANYKLYIIDEVHMLSNSAFNALLKLLEEPPLHLKFIFATTERSKVPLTIISRCQHFNLQKISTNKITNYLIKVSENEGFKISYDAIALLSELAAGSMRDGLSLLDQVVNFQQGQIEVEDLQKFFGIPESQAIQQIFQNLSIRNFLAVQSILSNLWQQGVGAKQLLSKMIDYVHQKLIGNQEKLVYYRVWNILLKGIKQLDSYDKPQAMLEVLCLEIIQAFTMPSVSTLINDLKKIDDSI